MNNSNTFRALKVLLVEDSAAIAIQLRNFLDEPENTSSRLEKPFTLTHVEDLASAISMVQDNPEIDVILLDLGLPDSDGLETFSRIHDVARDIPTVVFTGVNDEDVAIEALRLGAQDYLVKGQVDNRLLKKAIRYSVERKHVELTLRDKEEQHRALLESMPDIVYKIDPDGLIKYVNQAVSSLGFIPEELIGEHFSRFVHPEDVERASRRIVLPALKGKKTGLAGAPKLIDERRTKDRRTQDLVVRLIPKGWENQDETGLVIGSITSYGEITAAGTYFTDKMTKKQKFSGTVGIIKDITDRMRVQEERIALEEQLRQSQKMEAIGRLAGGVAHDMNNVLGAIQGSASVLDFEIEAKDAKKQDIENILVACRKGRDLTRDLLGFARKGKYVKQSISLNHIAREAEALLSRTIDKKIQLATDLQKDIGLIEGDRSQIHHALMNVCINAADAMDGREGTLTLRTSNIELNESNSQEISGLTEGRYVRIQVVDTGIGMDEETLQKVFEPFYTTKGQGTGLGLSMVYGVIKNHGGSVVIDSQPNIGTAVTFLLPEQAEATLNSEVDSLSDEYTDLGRTGVLLVDDEQIIRRSVGRLLDKLGYTVFMAEGGRAAIDIFQRKRKDVSLVLLDLIMPEMDGTETYDELRKIDPDVCVLLSSGYSKDEKVEALLNKGVRGYIQKPFDMSTLSETITTTLAQEIKKSKNSG